MRYRTALGTEHLSFDTVEVYVNMIPTDGLHLLLKCNVERRQPLHVSAIKLAFNNYDRIKIKEVQLKEN